MVSDEMGSGTGHECGPRRAIKSLGSNNTWVEAKGEEVFELIDDQAVALNAQALFGNWGSGPVAAQPFKFCAFAGNAQATAQLSEKPSRAMVKGLVRVLSSFTALGLCKVMVLRPA